MRSIGRPRTRSCTSSTNEQTTRTRRASVRAAAVRDDGLLGDGPVAENRRGRRARVRTGVAGTCRGRVLDGRWSQRQGERAARDGGFRPRSWRGWRIGTGVAVGGAGLAAEAATGRGLIDEYRLFVQPGRAGRRDAVLPGCAGLRSGAARDAHVRLARRLPPLRARLRRGRHVAHVVVRLVWTRGLLVMKGSPVRIRVSAPLVVWHGRKGRANHLWATDWATGRSASGDSSCPRNTQTDDSTNRDLNDASGAKPNRTRCRSFRSLGRAPPGPGPVADRTQGSPRRYASSRVSRGGSSWQSR